MFDNKLTDYIVMVFKVKSAALDCCRLLSREKGGLNEAVTQVVVMDMDFISMEDTLILAALYDIVVQDMMTLVLYGRYSDSCQFVQ